MGPAGLRPEALRQQPLEPGREVGEPAAAVATEVSPVQSEGDAGV